MIRLAHLLVALVAGLALVFAHAPSAEALNPSRTYKQRPDKYNMAYKAVKVKTNDGAATLNVWDFAPKGDKKGVILLVHSGAGNMADYLRRVDQFTSIGYQVVTFDYRGYGESSEFEIDTKMFIYPHFQDDVQTMFDYTRKTHGATFDVYGWGIGGGLALGIGWGRPESRRIIADTPFHSMEDLETRFEDWDEPMEVPFAGYEKRFEPATTVTQTPGKNLQNVQLIVGSNDILYKVADMQALGKRTSDKKIFDEKHVYVVENPDRKDNFRVDKAAYFATVKSALGQ